METMSSLIIIAWLLGVVLVIAWILLPFAMFGLKPLLRDLIKETRETNQLLRSQREHR